MCQYSLNSPAVKEELFYEMPYVMPSASTVDLTSFEEKETEYLLGLSQQFPDLPLFISHEQFTNFFHLWISYQKQFDLAQVLQQQWMAQSWLRLSLKDLDQIIQTVIQGDLFRLDSRALLAALRGLKAQMETTYQTLGLEHCLYLPSWTVDPVPEIRQETTCSAPVATSMPVFDWPPAASWGSVPLWIDPWCPTLASLPVTPTWTEDSSLSIEEMEASPKGEDDSDDDTYSEKPKRKRAQAKPTDARRTATSYDAQTTRYLKAVFFDIYSVSDKLTKEQRRKVQQDTGLKPRNITYWFSNHKRRFQNSLAVFRKTVNESHGQIKTYHEFLKWRKDRGLSEDVLENEQ
ncbi:hypothetical protein BY458DRAFT_513586 [Sporodiniella umbellata]|nr:hypothetical protein BY458DRAFT_513586 [Sporodiniella umbellata]